MEMIFQKIRKFSFNVSLELTSSKFPQPVGGKMSYILNFMFKGLGKINPCPNIVLCTVKRVTFYIEIEITITNCTK